MLSANLRGSPCIGESVLAAFAEGQIDQHAQGPIEEHLADCEDCREVLARAAEGCFSPESRER